MGRSSKKIINKDIAALNNVVDQMDLIDIYIETFIPKNQNTYSFQMHVECFQMIGHKTSLNKFKKI